MNLLISIKNFFIGENFKILRRAIRIFSKQDRRRILLITCFQVMFGILDLIGVLTVGLLGTLAISGIQSKTPGGKIQTFLDFLNLNQASFQIQVAILGVVSASVFIIRTILSVVFTRRILFFLSRKSATISANLVQNFFAQNLLQVQSKPSQQVLYAIVSGVNTIALGIIGTLVTLISDLSLFALMSITLFAVDPWIALGTLLVFGTVAYVLYKLMNKRALEIGISSAQLSIRSNEMILEVLNSFREVVVKNQRAFYVSEIQKSRLKMANDSAEISFMPYIGKYIIESIVIFGTLVVAAFQFITQDATRAIGVLAIFLAAGSRIAPAVLRIQQASIQIKSSLGAAYPTLELIESFNQKSQRFEPEVICNFNYPNFSSKITLQNLDFTYPENRAKTISGISLDIEAGSSVAIVGPSGAGKTTLVDLMLGLIEPDAGTIQISGVAPREAINTWPGAISYVPQNITIINGTVSENIALGFPQKSIRIEEIRNALKVAQLWDFVESLPNGINSVVGERGSRLSGGQRQRLGIARALYTNPQLLVFDEATSSLDGSTELEFSKAIAELKGKKTVILIAHRLTTVRAADQVVYLEKGRIIASGNFELIRKQVPDFDIQSKLEIS